MEGLTIVRLRLFALLLLGQVITASAQSKSDESEPPKEHKLAPAIRIAEQAKQVADGLEDYSANYYKKEIVNNRVIVHSMSMKIRHEPFSTYLRFHKPHEGREVIYVKGANQGNLLAHETGLKSVVGTVSLHPESQEALSESKHPITEIGIANMAKHIIEQWKFESKYGECEVKYFPNAKLGDKQACKVIESSHPVPRKQFKFHKTRLYIDKETNLPIMVEQFGFPPQQGAEPPLLEVHIYSNVRTDLGMTDIDFSPNNPNYGF
jgi:hypothetical protein